MNQLFKLLVLNDLNESQIREETMSQFIGRMEIKLSETRLTRVGILEQVKVNILLDRIKTAMPTTYSLICVSKSLLKKILLFGGVESN